MGCNCKSYNHPEWGGVVPEAQISLNGKSVCVDSCIVNEVEILNKCGVQTLGSCCGHNRQNPCVVVDREQAIECMQILGEISSREWDVYAWELVKQRPDENQSTAQDGGEK